VLPATGTPIPAATEAATETPTETVSGEEAVAPSITSPTSGDSLNNAGVQITGTAASGASVDVQVDGVSVGSVTAGSDGTWSADATLDDGDHTITAVVTQSDGTSLESEPVTVSVSTAQAVAPVITSPKYGDTLEAGEIEITGTGAPGGRLQLLDNGSTIGEVTVGSDGTWTFVTTVSEGDHTFIAYHTDADLPSGSVKVSVKAVVVLPPVGPCTIGYRDGQTYVVGNCQNLTEIAEVLDTTVDDLVNANPGIDPDNIDAGQVINIPEGK
jgi:hypothetical protein